MQQSEGRVFLGTYLPSVNIKVKQEQRLAAFFDQRYVYLVWIQCTVRLVMLAVHLEIGSVCWATQPCKLQHGANVITEQVPRQVGSTTVGRKTAHSHSTRGLCSQMKTIIYFLEGGVFTSESALDPVFPFGKQ